MDAWPGAGPHLAGDIARLPVRDGTVARLYCGHILEHVDLAALPAVLVELRRVLSRSGQLCVVGPDYDRAVGVDEPDEVLLRVIRDGGDRWPGDRHLWLSTEQTALRFIRSVFPVAHPVPIADLPDDWPVVSRVWWQFAIRATKENDG